MAQSVCFTQAKQHKRALKAATEATEVAPGSLLAWMRKMDAEVNMGNTKDAVAAAQRAVQLEPHVAVTHRRVKMVLAAAPTETAL